MLQCDFCKANYIYADRRVVALPRPSDSSELVAVMWGCGTCDESRELPTAASLYKLVMSGMMVDGVFYQFITV